VDVVFLLSFVTIIVLLEIPSQMNVAGGMDPKHFIYIPNKLFDRQNSFPFQTRKRSIVKIYF